MNEKAPTPATARRSRLRRAIVLPLVVALGTMAALLQLAAPASAVPSCVNQGSSFSSVMSSGHCIHSPNGQYVLIMQTDGNLVLYRSSGGAACWASGGSYRAGDKALFSQIGIPILGGDTEYGLAVGHDAGPGNAFFSASWRYDNGDFHVGDRSYNVNVNDGGQFYVAYDRIAGC